MSSESSVLDAPRARGDGGRIVRGMDSRARPSAQAIPPGPDLKAERALAATVSESRMVEAVRRWSASARACTARRRTTPPPSGWRRVPEAGLEVTVRKDTPRDWYQPVSWEVRVRDAAGTRPSS